jgi:hypothetical protein
LHRLHLIDRPAHSQPANLPNAFAHGNEFHGFERGCAARGAATSCSVGAEMAVENVSPEQRPIGVEHLLS